MKLLNQGILAIYTRDLKAGHHATKIAKLINANQKTIANHMAKLEQEGVLKSQIQGKNKLYFFNLNDIGKNKLLQVEIEKHTQFLRTDFRVRDLLKQLCIPQVLIFGSYAKGRPKESSDLDLFVVGTYDRKKISELEGIYQIEINVIEMSEKNFINQLKRKAVFINEVIKDHIIVSGVDYFIDQFLAYYYGARHE